jgi:hypothetical protein
MVESRLAMMTLVFTCLMLGAVLGQRFRVLVLFPGMVVVWPITTVAAAVRGYSFGHIVLAVVVATVSLQIGYLGGIGIRYLVVRATRARGDSRNAPTTCGTIRWKHENVAHALIQQAATVAPPISNDVSQRNQSPRDRFNHVIQMERSGVAATGSNAP